MFTMIFKSMMVILMFFFLYIFWNLVMSVYNTKEGEKKSVYECGFMSVEKSRIPFSSRFFLLLMLFIVFDMELSILLQLPVQMTMTLFKKRLIYLSFMLILTFGLFEEWRRGALQWLEES